MPSVPSRDTAAPYRQDSNHVEVHRQHEKGGTEQVGCVEQGSADPENAGMDIVPLAVVSSGLHSVGRAAAEAANTPSLLGVRSLDCVVLVGCCVEGACFASFASVESLPFLGATTSGA